MSAAQVTGLPREWDGMPWPARRAWLARRQPPAPMPLGNVPAVRPVTSQAKARAARRKASAVVLYRLGMSIDEIAVVQRVGYTRCRNGLLECGEALRPSGWGTARATSVRRAA